MVPHFQAKFVVIHGPAEKEERFPAIPCELNLHL